MVLVSGHFDHLPHTQSASWVKCQVDTLPPQTGKKIKWSKCPLDFDEIGANENTASGQNVHLRYQCALCCFLFFLRQCRFVLCLPQGFLPFALPLDLRRIPTLITAEFHIRPRCAKGLAAILTSDLTAALLCRFLSIILCSAICITKLLCG